MDSKDAPEQSVGGSKSPVASPKSAAGSPRSPVASPGSPAGSPGQQAQSPTPGNLLPGNYWNEAPEDDGPIEEDAASSTASLSSSVLKYRTIHGRTYHSNRGNAEYWASNDEGQNDALDLAHYAHTVILGDKLFLPPLKDDIQKVVDIGTGTGSWAIDFADEYPNCEVVGTDISPIQPTWIPPNLKFEIDDCTQSWTFEPDSIDFVHLRYLVGSIQDWPALMKEAYRCTKPGGWVQSLDGGAKLECEPSTTKAHTATSQWGEFFAEGGRMLGRSFTIVQDGVQRKSMEEAGFVDIIERCYKVPVGTWPKDPTLKQVGGCTFRAIYDDVEGYMTYLATIIGWSQAEVMVYAAHLRRELRDQDIHKFYRLNAVYGRKPEY